jgi:hypothetical protein
MLFDLSAERPEQGDLFIEADPKERALMGAVDWVNAAYGTRSVQLAGAGLKGVSPRIASGRCGAT